MQGGLQGNTRGVSTTQTSGQVYQQQQEAKSQKRISRETDSDCVCYNVFLFVHSNTWTTLSTLQTSYGYGFTWEIVSFLYY